MAKTIFDAPANPRPARAASIVAYDEPEPKEIPSQAEEGEPPVEAIPRLTMTALGYLAPRKGIDAPGDFRSCMSCRNFVPERAFHAATTGNHCVLLGTWPIEPHGNCNHYAPWGNGKPVEAAIEAHALACLNGSRAALTPWDVNYCCDHGHSHKCRDCKHFDRIGDADTNGPECELAEEFNREIPNVFQASESVDPDGGCNAWAEPVPDESNPSGKEGQ